MTRGELLQRIRVSGGLVKTYRPDERVVVFELLNGEAVPNARAAELIAMGRLVPQQDGLFGDSQVYKVRDAA